MKDTQKKKKRGKHDVSSDDEETETQSTTTAASNAPKELSRAEKRKAKKMKKYKDQDEDDKELHMRLCGWDGGLNALEATAAAEAKAAADANAEKVTFDDDAAFKRDTKPGDGPPDAEKEVAMELDLIDHLTGRPLDDDLILHPMLMVGPVEAVENWKFSVSIMPGKEKKGKAAQALLHHLSKSLVSTDQERDHMKRMDLTQGINLLPSNLRIVTDAAAQSKTKHQRPSKPKRR